MAGKADRKLYVAALGVALAGLGLDRVMFRGEALSPRTAAAATPEAPAPAPSPSGPSVMGAAEATTLLADRLKSLEQQRGLDPTAVRDVFWLEGVSTRAAAPGAAEAAKEIEAFKATHRLRTVMSRDGVWFVVVGDTRLEIGQSLGDFTLVAIEVNRMPRRAVFDFNGHSVALTMDAEKVAGTGGEPQGEGGGGR